MEPLMCWPSTQSSQSNSFLEEIKYHNISSYIPEDRIEKKEQYLPRCCHDYIELRKDICIPLYHAFSFGYQ